MILTLSVLSFGIGMHTPSGIFTATSNGVIVVSSASTNTTTGTVDDCIIVSNEYVAAVYGVNYKLTTPDGNPVTDSISANSGVLAAERDTVTYVSEGSALITARWSVGINGSLVGATKPLQATTTVGDTLRIVWSNYTNNSIAASAQASLSARTNGWTSTFFDSNTNRTANSLIATAASVSGLPYPGQGCLISPNVFLNAYHAMPNVGSTVWFQDTNSALQSVTILAKTNIVSFPYDDLGLALLSSPVPHCTPVKLIPTNAPTYSGCFTNGWNFPCVAIRQQSKAVIKDLKISGNTMIESWSTHFPQEYSGPVLGGDSGGACVVFINEEIYLAGSLTDSAGRMAFPAAYFSTINEAITNMATSASQPINPAVLVDWSELE